MAQTWNQSTVQALLNELSPPEKEMLFILAFNRFGIPGYKISAISLRIASFTREEAQIGRNGAKKIGKSLVAKSLIHNKGGIWGIEEEPAWPILRYGFLDGKGQVETQEVEIYQTSILQELPYSYWDLYRLGTELLLRHLQMGLLTGDRHLIMTALRQMDQSLPDGKSGGEWLQSLLGIPIDLDLLSGLQPSLQLSLLGSLCKHTITDFESPNAISEGLERLLPQTTRAETRVEAFLTLGELYLLQGNFDLLTDLISKVAREEEGIALLLQASMLMLKGDNAYALKQFNAASRKLKAKGYFPSFSGILHGFLLLFSHNLKKVHTFSTKDSQYTSVQQVLHGVALFLENQIDASKEILSSFPSGSPLADLYQGIAAYWCDFIASSDLENALISHYELAKTNGLRFFQLELAALLGKTLGPEERAIYQQEAESLAQELGVQPFIDRIARTETWERALEGLIHLTESTGKSKTVANSRLVWRVDFDKEIIQPVEQKMTKTGKWSKGRNVALKRLKEEGMVGMTDQDDRVVRHIQSYSSGWYGQTHYEINFAGALAALIGHPLLFLYDNPSLVVELVETKPELIITQKESGYTLSIHPELAGPGTQLIRETSTRYQLITVTESQWQVAQYLGNKTLTVPTQGKKQLSDVLGRVSTIMRVQSDLVGQTSAAQEIVADTKPHVLLVPIGEDFKVEVFSKPLGKEPPYLKPGAGRESLFAEVNGVQVIARRNLEAEKELATELVREIETLTRNVSHDWEWYLEDRSSCLSLLTELSPLRKAGKVVVEWPKGEPFQLAGQADFSQVRLRVSSKKDWFAVEGEIQVDENQVIQLEQLLTLMQGSEDSQFVELSDGRYLALTEQLRRHLMELAALAERKGDDLRLHPLMAESLQDFSDMGAQLKVNAAWKRRIKALKEARAFQPQLPHTLQADLRPYQEEGYFWLARLAKWGVGACLADDMGLGKTLQALTLLLDRAHQGPSLVVAPASVVRNWMREAERFTPDLNPILLSESNRDEVIAELKPYDLLLVSYNLLQIEREKLGLVSFGTLVLDEAQAIKNRQTKRSKAAKEIQAGFRVLTTGTPIENHLGELWNLFDFLNPGLLGSLERFNEKFAGPIEKFHDQERKHQLRKLIRPFILRRRKSEVLEDLPEKTEITLTVELSQQELAFYEALRRKAVDRLANASSDSKAGEQHMRILAEITKLRLASCHPQLAVPESELGSSKLALFAEVVEDLRANGHKALVFSQFVKHLHLVEDLIKDRNISYQYLDGSTPLKEREKRVQAFQQGQGDLFLISLKAGGTGLNLTAADYVIHLDPWWNPAVEDQASDRAHRIGQQRPVTVYRLVSGHTIEEKIVQLHGQKRELADSLLEGTDSGARLTSDELLKLIQEA